MHFKIDEGDIVEKDSKDRIIKIDKPSVTIRIKYRDDGSVWMTDYHKKL